jgi:hypothetical protein
MNGKSKMPLSTNNKKSNQENQTCAMELCTI